MKKILCTLLLFALFSAVRAQGGADTALQNRLERYLRLNREQKFDSLMAYVHPALFRQIPRESLLQFFKKTFDNDDMRVIVDSAVVSSVSAPFTFREAQFRKVDYRMVLTLKLKDSSITALPENIGRVTGTLQTAFPGSQVSYLPFSHDFQVKAPNFLFAIKDRPSAPWMFLGYQKNEEFVKKLFPQEVIDHFHLL